VQQAAEKLAKIFSLRYNEEAYYVPTEYQMSEDI